MLSNLQQLELKFNALSGTKPDEIFNLTSLVKLDLAEQVWNDWNCTCSNGTVVNTYWIHADPEEGENYGLECEILGTKIGQMKYLRNLDVTNNYFSGNIASEIGILKQLGMF